YASNLALTPLLAHLFVGDKQWQDDVSGDVIHADFFPFSAGPYYTTYPEGDVAENCKFTRKEWDAPYRPTFRVLTKEVFKDTTICKTLVDQFPTPG
nr:hypothetical protein [Tanacetum cinerariifolium]